MKRLEIKPSSLDLQAPSSVEVVYRLTGKPERARQPPPVIADYPSAEVAQARSDELTARKEWHSYLTWWKRRSDGRRVNKWATMLAGKRRYFKVSVPYVQGINDEMVKVLLRQAIATYPDRPKDYDGDTIKVTIDAEANRTELGGVALRLPPEYAERAKALTSDQLSVIVQAALDREGMR